MLFRSVLFADIEGFNALSEQMAPEQSILLLNELIGAFDEAAERLGMEKLRSVGSSYLAVCGLSIPRVDHERRSVDFGFELLQITSRLNHKRQVDLSLDIGVHTGSISAGVVGMILHLAWELGRSVVHASNGGFDWPAFGALLVAFALLRWARWPSLAVIALSASWGILRWRLAH